MSASVLIHGKIHRDPESKMSGKGNAYALATVRDSQGDDTTWWRVFAFGTEARDELLSLRAGDGVAVSGAFKAELYAGSGTARVSLSVTADRVISAKRQKRDRASEVRGARKASGSADRPGPWFSDEVPF